AMTSDRDPHPLVVSEGATFGCPTVVSDRVGCIGPNDTARPDVNALVYPCGDTVALQRALERLYTDRELYKRMAAAALQIAETQDVSAAARDLQSAADELCRLGPR